MLSSKWRNNKASDIKLVYIYSTIKDKFCAWPHNDGFRRVTVVQHYTFLDWWLFGGMQLASHHGKKRGFHLVGGWMGKCFWKMPLNHPQKCFGLIMYSSCPFHHTFKFPVSSQTTHSPPQENGNAFLPFICSCNI